MRKYFLLPVLAGLCLMQTVSRAEIKLPSIFSDNMVLQQNTSVNIWGKAAPGAEVIIRAGWSDREVSIVADGNGEWRTVLATEAAGGPFKLSFFEKSGKSAAKSSLTLSNVMLGEVWLCSGQSNMQMPLNGFTAQPVDGAASTIMHAKPSKPVRVCKITGLTDSAPENYSDGWWTNTPANAAQSSAVAYYFADAMTDFLGVPVGVIYSAAGGTKVDSWMVGEFLYKKHIEPVIDFTFKGMIWYQGESNMGDMDYDRKMVEFIKSLREVHNAGNFPFYIVQIPPCRYEGEVAVMAPYLLECQQKAADALGNCHLVTTLDCGDEFTEHPFAKKPVGDRIAWLALQEEYGVKAIVANAPKCVNVEFSEGRALARFDTKGVGALGQVMKGFELAGADKVFHPAEARVITDSVKRRDTIEVTSKDVPEPVALRYCFHDWCVPTVFNAYGIPAGPFRTDDWSPAEVSYVSE